MSEQSDLATQEARAAVPTMQADIDGGRFLFGDGLDPSRGGSWAWLQSFAQTAQYVVREQKPAKMRVLITWEYEPVHLMDDGSTP